MKKNSIARFLLFVILLCSVPLSAAEYKPIELDPTYDHDKWGTEPKDIVKKFRAYTVSFDGPDDDDGDGQDDKWAIPEWVAYEIKAYPGVLPPGPERPNPWLTDKELYAQRIAAADESYQFSKAFRKAHPDSPQLGYDRGHMCMKLHAWRLGANADWNTHTTLNACPQKSDLNQGIWLDLEKKTAEWADRYGAVWIVTGPIIYGKRPRHWLGEEGEVPVAIPDAFFKIVVRETGGSDGPEVLAFVYPQEGHGYKQGGGYDHTPYLASVDMIEALTGLDFLTVLPDDVEERIEAPTAVAIWK